MEVKAASLPVRRAWYHLPPPFPLKPFYRGMVKAFLLVCQLPSTGHGFLDCCVARDSEGISRFSRKECCVQLVVIIPEAALKVIRDFLVYI